MTHDHCSIPPFLPDRILTIIVAAGVCFMLGVAPARAAWEPNGNIVTLGFQSATIVADGTGGAFILWSPQGSVEIHVQRIDASGLPVSGWPSPGRLVGTGDLQNVILDPASGGLYMLYRIGSQLRLLRIDSNGFQIAGWPANGVLVSDHYWYGTGMMTASAGGVYIGWFDAWFNSSEIVIQAKVSVQWVDAAGGFLWPQSLDLQTVNYPQYVPGGISLASARTGLNPDFYVTWALASNTFTTDYDSSIARVSHLGSFVPNWAPRAPLPHSSYAPTFPAVVVDDGGNCIAVQACSTGVGLADMRANRWLVDGGHDASWPNQGKSLFANETRLPFVLARDDGGFIVCMVGGLTHAQRFDTSGNPVWVFPVALASTPQGPQGFSAVSDGAGGALTVWTDALSPYDLHGQSVSSSGKLGFPSTGKDLCTASGAQQYPLMARTADRNGILIFTDKRTGGHDLYAQNFKGYGNVYFKPLQGWYKQIVPHAVPDAIAYDVTPPGGLPHGNGTWVNWAASQVDGPLNPWWTRLVLDEEEILTNVSVQETVPDQDFQILNQGPYAVRGGRHSVGVTLDPDDVVPESDETDNSMETQWVWEPLVTSAGGASLRAVPPSPISPSSPYPNGDGFSFTRNPSYAWVASLAPVSAGGDDYDLYAFNDYSGPESGFSNLIGYSVAGGNQTDFVVGHYSGTPTTIYPEAIRYAAPVHADYVVDQIDASNRNAGSAGSFLAQDMAGYRLADVYEGFFAAGQTIYLSLRRLLGNSDLSVAVFPGTGGGIYGRLDAQATATPLSADVDSIVYLARDTGWHPIVVFRTDGTNSSERSRYNLQWNTAPVAVEEGATPSTVELSGAMPNPARGVASFEIQLPSAEPVRLEIFDLAGRRIATLRDGVEQAGRIRAVWDGKAPDGRLAATGLYCARLEAGERVISRRFALLR